MSVGCGGDGLKRVIRRMFGARAESDPSGA